MNKFTTILSILLSSFIFVGCEKTIMDSTIPQITSKIESNIKISFQDNEYECSMLHTPEGLTTLNFNSPESLKDFTISRNCGKYEVTQGGLQGEYMKEPLPKDSPIKYFIDILDVLDDNERPFKLKSEEEGEKIYSGNLAEKECTVVLGRKDEIIRIEMQEPKFEVQFKE